MEIQSHHFCQAHTQKFCRTQRMVMTNKNETKSFPPSVTIFRLADRPIVVKKASIKSVCNEVSKLTFMKWKYSRQESTSATNIPPRPDSARSTFLKRNFCAPSSEIIGHRAIATAWIADTLTINIPSEEFIVHVSLFSTRNNYLHSWPVFCLSLDKVSRLENLRGEIFRI